MKFYLLPLLLLPILTACSVPDKKEDILLVVPPAEEPVTEVPEQVPGISYVEKVMDACGAKMSEARRKILATQIEDVGNRMFEKGEHRKWFYFLICIESRFRNEARSTAGATGLTQVMPQYAKEFAKACGLGELEPKDLADSQVNLLVGACRFRELMLYYEGDPTLALAAYNSGLNSPTVRKAVTSDIRTGHPETVGYLAAAFVLEQRLEKESKNVRQEGNGPT
jgi:hypothetical protein